MEVYEPSNKKQKTVQYDSKLAVLKYDKHQFLPMLNQTSRHKYAEELLHEKIPHIFIPEGTGVKVNLQLQGPHDLQTQVLHKIQLHCRDESNLDKVLLNWHYADSISQSYYASSTILQMASGNVIPDVLLSSILSDSAIFLQLYQVCRATNLSIIAKMSLSGEELLYLVPYGENSLAGWIVDPCILEHTLKVFHARKLAVVLDLDETLIKAYTLSSFNRLLLNSEDLDPESRMKVGQWANALSQFTKNDTVYDSNSREVYQARRETVIDSQGTKLFRPVIRINAPKVEEPMGMNMQEQFSSLAKNMIFTRINPQENSSSLVMFIRPGWDELRRELIELTKGKRKQASDLTYGIKVYVCTTAEREYAFEAWRLLDPNNDIIPREELSARLINVNNKNEQKSLKSVLKMNFSTSGEVPFALIIDDRQDVWVEGDRNLIIPPPAFLPHKKPSSSFAYEHHIMVDLKVFLDSTVSSIWNYVNEELHMRKGDPNAILGPRMHDFFKRGRADVTRKQEIERLNQEEDHKITRLATQVQKLAGRVAFKILKNEKTMPEAALRIKTSLNDLVKLLCQHKNDLGKEEPLSPNEPSLPLCLLEILNQVVTKFDGQIR